MSKASQYSFGNAAVLTTGIITGNLGVAASEDLSSFVSFSGNSVANGQFNNSNTDPSANTRLNYNGSLYATNLTATTGITGAIKPRVVTIANGSSISINADVTDIVSQVNTQTAGSTLTINAITGTFTDGQKIIIRLKSTNSQLLSWANTFGGSSDLVLPLASTGSDKYDYMGFIYNELTNKWHLLAKNFGF
jgi:hypothetical protein